MNHLTMTAMRKHIFSFILIYFIISMAGLTARGVWSLERCIDHALENNLDVRSQRLYQEFAEHDLRQSYTNVLPGVSIGTRFGYNYGRNIDEVTYKFSTERVGSQRITAQADLTLFAGFRTINTIRYNLARQTAFRYDTERLENDLVLTIANAYLQILYFEDMLEVAGQQLALHRQQVERTRILLEGGTVSRRDLLEMEAVAAEQEVVHTSIENQLNLSYLELIHLLELDPEDEFHIERPVLDVEDARFLYDPDAVLEKAKLIEPSLSAAKKRIMMAQRGLAIANGERLPTLTLNTSMGTQYSEIFTRMVNGNHEHANAAALYDHFAGNAPVLRNDPMPAEETIPYRDQLTENYARSAFVTLSIPIFNHYRTRTRIQHARIDLDRAQIAYEGAKINLSRIIHQAHADALAAYKEYNSNGKALEASRESFNYAREGYDLGRVSTIALNEAQARLNRAEVNLLQSMYEFVFKVKILEFYQGEGFVL